MKKHRSVPYTEILYVTYILATIVSIYISYNDFDSTRAFNFVLGYLFFTFFMLIFFPVKMVMSMVKFDRKEVRKSIVKFLTYFILISVSIYTFNFIFRPDSIDIVRIISVSLGCSFGSSFFNYIYLSRKNR